MAGNYEKRGDSYRLRFFYKGKTYYKTIKLGKGQKVDYELQKFVDEIKTDKMINSNIDFFSFSQKWLDDYAKPNLRERTVQGYKDYLNLRLIPYFGNMSLSDIQLYDIQKFINSLTTSLSTESIKKYKNCLSCIFKYAVMWKFLKYNPCAGVIIPKGLNTSIKPVFLTKNEVNYLLECLGKEPLKYQIIVRLALQCGMRRSEILGISWNAINFRENTISIFQATSTIKGKGTIVSDTKNASSIRTIYAKKEIIDLIKLLPKNNDLIFGYMHNDTITTWFNRFLKKYNLKHMRFHDLRHTHATLLIANNVDMKTVSARLGHSNISTTLNIYTHALSENDKKASELI